MNEEEIFQEEENILQAAAQHQDRLAQEERARKILCSISKFRSLDIDEDDIDFLASMCGVSDYRK